VRRTANPAAPRATTRLPGRRLGACSSAKPCDEVVEPRSGDGQELGQVLSVSFGDPALAIVADRAREFRERFVQLSRCRDERIVTEGRYHGFGPQRLLAGVQDPLDLIVQPEERELSGDDLLRERLTAPLVLDLHELVRRGEGVVSLRDHVVNVVRRRRQTQTVLDVALVLAQLRREVTDRVPQLVGHLLVDDGLVERGEVFALQVLDERDLERGRVIEALDDGRDRLFACELGRAPAALARDDLVPVTGRTNEDRLQDAVLADRSGELRERVFVPGHAGLARVGDDLLERDVTDRGGRSRSEQADDARLRVSLLLEDPLAGIAEALSGATTCEHRSTPWQGPRSFSPRRSVARTR